MKVCCMFSLNEAIRKITHNIPLPNLNKLLTQNYPEYKNVCSLGFFCWGLKNEFEIAVVNEPSVFAPPNFYCYNNNKNNSYNNYNYYYYLWLIAKYYIFHNIKADIF